MNLMEQRCGSLQDELLKDELSFHLIHFKISCLSLLCASSADGKGDYLQRLIHPPYDK